MKKIAITFSIFIIFLSLSFLVESKKTEAYFGVSVSFGSNNGYGYGGYNGYDPNNWRAYSNGYSSYGNSGYFNNYSSYNNYGYGNNMDGYFYSVRPSSPSRYNYNQNYSTGGCNYGRCY